MLNRKEIEEAVEAKTIASKLIAFDTLINLAQLYLDGKIGECAGKEIEQNITGINYEPDGSKIMGCGNCGKSAQALANKISIKQKYCNCPEPLVKESPPGIIIPIDKIPKRVGVEGIETELNNLEDKVCKKCEVYNDRTMCACWLAKNKCLIDKIDNKTRAQAIFKLI